MNQLKDRLAKAMKSHGSKGITAYKLWQLSGITQSTIGRILKGGSTYETTLKALAQSLHVSYQWLSYGKGAMRLVKGSEPNLELNTTAERVEYIRTDNGLTYGSFGERIGVEGGTMQAIISNEKVRDVYLVAVASVFNVNLDWLKTGEGEVYSSVISSEGKPFYDLVFESNPEVIIENTQPIGLVQIPDINEVDFWVRTGGSSMEPKINRWDVVALKRISEADYPNIQLGLIYAIQTKAFRTIKYVQRGSNQESFVLVSNDLEVPGQEISFTAIVNLYKITGRFSMMGAD